MTKVEYARCEKLMEEAIKKAKAANEDFSNYNTEKDEVNGRILLERGQNHLGYAEGIHQALAVLGFKHTRMQKLSDLL